MSGIEELLLKKILPTLIVLILSIWGARILKRMIEVGLSKVACDKIDRSAIQLFSKTSSFFVYLIGVYIILCIYKVNTSGFVAILGTAGLAIGLALKDTLSNIAAGLMIIIIRPFMTGDFIETTVVSGSVKAIGLFTTSILTADGVYVMVPNSVLWGVAIKNYTRNDSRRISVSVGISYKDSIDEGMRVLLDVAKSEEKVLEGTVPEVMVSDLAQSSVDLTLRLWVKKEDYWSVLFSLKKKIKEEIEKAGLSIPFPQCDVHVVKE